MTTMRALVTGCAGFIGSQLADSLLVDGADVQAVDCFTENYGRAEKLQNLHQAREWDSFSFAELDLVEADLTGLVEAVDVIVHLAGEPGVRSSWGSQFRIYTRNNVLATQRLLEALTKWPEKRFVFASSSSIYGQAERLPTPESVTPKPLSPYGVTKLAAEHLVQLYAVNYGIDAISLRYFSVYGPRQRPDMAFHQFIRAALEGAPMTLFGDGSQTRDFTFVSDIVAATKAALISPASQRLYNVGAGSRLPLSSAIELIGELTGRRLKIRSTASERGDARDTGADITRARVDLGYEPRVDVREGLAAELDWMLESTRERRVETGHL